MKLIYAAAALAVMSVSPVALAQTTPSQPSTKPSQPSTTPPAATQPGANQPGSAQPGATEPKSMQQGGTTTGTATQTGASKWYSHQPGEMRASKLIGTSVKNDAGESIGDINEVILTKNGDVAAVVIGVGGFLGIGEREVAVAFDSLRMSMDNNQRSTVTIAATKDTLKSAPEWKWSNAGNGATPGRTSPGGGTSTNK